MDKTSEKKFVDRHIGSSTSEIQDMLSKVGCDSIEELMNAVIPQNIQITKDLNLPEALSESKYIEMMSEYANKTKLNKNFIGQGYYGNIIPSVVLRSIFQNPGWYTQYTPYQAEISQGRLEALFYFQTMVSELTGLPIANSSLLDEGTALAEAMVMIHHAKSKEKNRTKIFVDLNIFEQSKEVIKTRAFTKGFDIVWGNWQDITETEPYFAIIVQYPDARGLVNDYQALVNICNKSDTGVIVAADILALTIFTSPGSWGADVAVGSTQRLGVPMGFGGPSAAYFACQDKYKRIIPGRIIGLTHDRLGNPAYRMALQSREQHIKREKALSNICTSQVLLAIMSVAYVIYHGKEGLVNIAKQIYIKTNTLRDAFARSNYKLTHGEAFDTINVETNLALSIQRKCKDNNLLNIFANKHELRISIDQTTSWEEVKKLAEIFNLEMLNDSHGDIANVLRRQDDFLTHSIFHQYTHETDFVRYFKSLENKDLSLVHSMIPLGSCTMKLNAASTLMPLNFPQFANTHPCTPIEQVGTYIELLTELENLLCNITGLDKCSLQPNSGAQGEFAGLVAFKRYFAEKGEQHRNTILLPQSAHGTNPASAVLAGYEVCVIRCDDQGNIDLEDTKTKCRELGDRVAGIMITYPSTHGIFELNIIEVVDVVHQAGGLVYYDGANLNAMLGYSHPGKIGADICHLNLHKTFAIPHGGGGPGIGAICAAKSLEMYMPGHHTFKNKEFAVSSSPYGSAYVALISLGYIKMMGSKGLKKATQMAILNANYLKKQLENHYPVLFKDSQGLVAHEFIIDINPFKTHGIMAEDVAKRLIDYGFHAPTLSFPVPGTLMIEPTESESKTELDRFVAAMIAIRGEIEEVILGDFPKNDNVLVNAPHTIAELLSDDWSHSYGRQKAAYPINELKTANKFWASVARVNAAFGDRNLQCTCPPISNYQ